MGSSSFLDLYDEGSIHGILWKILKLARCAGFSTGNDLVIPVPCLGKEEKKIKSIFC